MTGKEFLNKISHGQGDLLQGKIWAATDAARRPSKRQKDLADIARLIELEPHLRKMLPNSLARQLVDR